MFLITMAGKSSRFFKQGYKVPKYMLPLWGSTVFDLSVSSFKRYFQTDKFIFVILDDPEIRNFVIERCTYLDILDYNVVSISSVTEGQAETAFLGLKDFNQKEPVYIFNIDTFRYDYIKPRFASKCDGYLEVFEGEGDHWSFIGLDHNNNVVETTEKNRISNLCSDGLYYFSNVKIFMNLFSNLKKNKLTTKGEYYIAPMYNDLINNNMIVKYEKIGLESIDFCGTPDEYEFLKARGKTK